MNILFRFDRFLVDTVEAFAQEFYFWTGVCHFRFHHMFSIVGSMLLLTAIFENLPATEATTYFFVGIAFLLYTIVDERKNNFEMTEFIVRQNVTMDEANPRKTNERELRIFSYAMFTVIAMAAIYRSYPLVIPMGMLFITLYVILRACDASRPSQGKRFELGYQTGAS